MATTSELPSASSPPLSPQPQITIEQTIDNPNQNQVSPRVSSPHTPLQFQSPLRHHKRTPSQHREIKETLDAKARDTSDDADGHAQHTVNQYVIKEEIGRGSYGAVHLATDQYGNEYAIKEFSKARLRRRAQSTVMRRPGPGRPHPLAPGGDPNQFYRKQFSRQEDAEAKDALHWIRQEIAIMKKLRHTNLVALIEVLDDPDGDSLYVVMEMCAKGVVMKVNTGDECVTPYDDEHCRTWFRDLILGIEYLHAQNIIHRDIKPDNLLLTKDDCLKVVDFGVSEMFEKPDDMVTSKSAGSPAFLPPELCEKHGDILGKAADLWSMGVTLYCLKYGKLPFKGDSPMDIYESIRTDPLSLPEDEDADFVDLMKRILDKESSTRITMPELRNHPWVTKNGTDHLLPEEDNCCDDVEPPNELEVNHAFTRKMDHLLCVMRAIHRFKSLVSSSRATTPRTPHTPSPLSNESKLAHTSDSDQSSHLAEPQRQKSIAEQAAELVEKRKAYQSSLSMSHVTSGENSNNGGEITTPAFLGIGTGEVDESRTADSAHVVSDSPTSAEFDVYDRAFETEIKRIRSDRRKNRAKTTTYMTKVLGEAQMNKYMGDDHMILEAGKSLANTAYTRGSEAASRGLARIQEARNNSHHEEGWLKGGQAGAQKVVDTAKETGYKFVDVVSSMTKDWKKKDSVHEQTDERS
ncbi:Pkinase-domain-containing protein [Xylariaceae sp. FL0255]|nr:Pkinase-domain-containing protein [Xylariaceae sp. FL0255]